MAATDAQTVELHDRTWLSVQYFRAADDDTAEFEIERTAGYEVVETWGHGVATDLNAPDWVHGPVGRAV